MSKYLLIESRDPCESGDVGNYFELAQGLAGDGNDVTLFLVQNGVLPAPLPMDWTAQSRPASKFWPMTFRCANAP